MHRVDWWPLLLWKVPLTHSWHDRSFVAEPFIHANPAPHFPQDVHLYPLVVPLHDPERYWPAAQLVLEQVAHCLLDANEQARVWYLPFPQVAQVAQAVLEVPEQPPLLYLPEAQVAQVEHWVLDAPEHPPLLYLEESPANDL